MPTGIYERIKPSLQKGKTLVELYGVEKAKQITEKKQTKEIDNVFISINKNDYLGLQNDVKNMKNDIIEVKNTLRELVEMMKAVYEFEDS